jgi:hypothetical protein
MKNKQTLKLSKGQEDEQIITIADSNTSYVDGNFFKTEMGEDSDNKNSITFSTDI